MSLRRFIPNIYFSSLLQTKQCFTPILAYRRSSVVVNRSYSNRIYLIQNLTFNINYYTKLKVNFTLQTVIKLMIRKKSLITS